MLLSLLQKNRLYKSRVNAKHWFRECCIPRCCGGWCEKWACSAKVEDVDLRVQTWKSAHAKGRKKHLSAEKKTSSEHISRRLDNLDYYDTVISERMCRI